MELSSLFNTIFIFFMVLDPLGNVPFFASILKPFDPTEQRRIIIRESLIALVVMILFLFFGRGLFRLLAIDLTALEISGGIILFLIALKLIFAPGPKSRKKISTKEPFIVPMAVPALAGPGILATISLYGASLHTQTWEVFVATVISLLLCIPILLLATTLKKFIGEKGLQAIEKLAGFIVVLLAVQMSINGLNKIFGCFS